jgi:hypothetical protein
MDKGEERYWGAFFEPVLEKLAGCSQEQGK